MTFTNFLQIYLIHVIIGSVLLYVLVPLLPKTFIDPFMKFGLTLRTSISHLIEEIYPRTNSEVFISSRLIAPFLLFLMLNVYLQSWIISLPSLSLLKYAGWALYGVFIINSVPTLDDWNEIFSGDNLAWGILLLKIAVIFDLFDTISAISGIEFLPYTLLLFPISPYLPSIQKNQGFETLPSK